MIFKRILLGFLFWIHLPVVLTMLGLFFIPTSIWPGRVSFHFYFNIIIITIQFLWGLIMYPHTKRIDIICPLTTATQYLRGHKITSDENHRHSFIVELGNKLKINLNWQIVNLLVILSVIVSIIIFIFFN